MKISIHCACMRMHLRIEVTSLRSFFSRDDVTSVWVKTFISLVLLQMNSQMRETFFGVVRGKCSLYSCVYSLCIPRMTFATFLYRTEIGSKWKPIFNIFLVVFPLVRKGHVVYLLLRPHGGDSKSVFTCLFLDDEIWNLKMHFYLILCIFQVPT